MPGLEKQPSIQSFNARVLTTFGELDEQDIAKINGCSERLVTQLMDLYGWGPAYAHTRVNQISSNSSDEPHVLTSGHTND